MNPGDLTQWYYLIYILPGGLSVFFLLMSALGGGRHHGGGVHHGAALSHHGTGSGGHMGPHSLAHTGHTGHAAHLSPHTTGRQGGQSAGFSALAYFGVGRLPSTFVWGSCLIGWGLFGFLATRGWQAALHTPAAFVLPAAGVAALGAALTMRMAALLGARLMPKDETAITSTIDLCGFTGSVVYPVDTAHGRVHVYDRFGTMHDVEARTAAGQGLLTKGSKVLVVDYDAAVDRVIVELAP